MARVDAPEDMSGHRHASIDVGRYLLLLGVIALHVLGAVPPTGLGLWAIVVMNLSHVAVPVYFVTAGYFLTWRSRDYVRCIAQPVTRLGPLYIVWLGVYVVHYFITVDFVWAWTPHDLLNGGPGYHLWFLPALLIALVLVALASKGAGTWGAFAICAILAGIGLSRGALHDMLGMPGAAQRAGILMAPMFVWLGTAIRAYAPDMVGRRAIWAVVVLLLLMQGAENAMSSRSSAGHLFVVRAFPLTMFATAVAVFLAIRSIPASIWPRWVIEQSRWSFGVYAVHLLVIYLIGQAIVPAGPGSFLLVVATVFVLSSLAVRLTAQIPPMRRFLA